MVVGQRGVRRRGFPRVVRGGLGLDGGWARDEGVCGGELF